MFACFRCSTRFLPPPCLEGIKWTFSPRLSRRFGTQVKPHYKFKFTVGSIPHPKKMPFGEDAYFIDDCGAIGVAAGTLCNALLTRAVRKCGFLVPNACTITGGTGGYRLRGSTTSLHRVLTPETVSGASWSGGGSRAKWKHRPRGAWFFSAKKTRLQVGPVKVSGVNTRCKEVVEPRRRYPHVPPVILLQ